MNELNDFALDDLDCLIILAIGDGNEVCKNVLDNARKLGLNIDAEDVRERLNSRSRIQLWYREGKRYRLTETGRKVYLFLKGERNELF